VRIRPKCNATVAFMCRDPWTPRKNLPLVRR